MCLTVLDIPESENDCIVYACYKNLRLIGRQYCTPQYNLPVSPTGWLLPRRWRHRQPVGLRGTHICGSYIHALTTPAAWKAVALNVCAFGIHSDLVCEALWIPRLAGSTRHETQRAIAKLQTRRDVRNYIKELRDVLNSQKANQY